MTTEHFVQPLSYDDVHLNMARVSPAGAHPCVGCDKKADCWTFNYPTGVKWLHSETGAPYSMDPRHYSPRCNSCHSAFDYTQSEARKEQWLEFLRKGGRTSAANMRLNPKHMELQRQNGINISQKNNAARRRCLECDFLSNRGNVGKHQGRTGHQGFADILG